MNLNRYVVEEVLDAGKPVVQVLPLTEEQEAKYLYNLMDKFWEKNLNPPKIIWQMYGNIMRTWSREKRSEFFNKIYPNE